MAKTKTSATGESVIAFIEHFAATDKKKADSLLLIERMRKISGYEPYMWGPSIIGFGSYHYIYDSGHEGNAPVLGFSPRKSAFSLYVYTALEEHEHLLENLGKFKMGKACIYINQLSDINLDQLDKVMKASLDYIRKKYPVSQ